MRIGWESVPGGRSGFTLMETLIAMTLAAAVLLPASFWLYQSRTSRAAMEKFRATQALEDRMNRAVLLRLERDRTEEAHLPGYVRLIFHVVRNAEETRIEGRAEDRRGRTLAELQAAYFGKNP
jgi:prepilin-type N-terminal cleavage/methylation domain-containing protein